MNSSKHLLNQNGIYIANNGSRAFFALTSPTPTHVLRQRIDTWPKGKHFLSELYLGSFSCQCDLYFVQEKQDDMTLIYSLNSKNPVFVSCEPPDGGPWNQPDSGSFSWQAQRALALSEARIAVQAKEAAEVWPAAIFLNEKKEGWEAWRSWEKMGSFRMQAGNKGMVILRDFP